MNGVMLPLPYISRTQDVLMKVIKDLQGVPDDLRGGVMTIGNFDGVHLAHQAIIKRVVDDAKRGRQS